MTARLLSIRGSMEQAEQALRTAPDYPSLEEAWWRDCSHYEDESAAREHLLTIYHERAHVFAVEMAKLSLA